MRNVIVIRCQFESRQGNTGPIASCRQRRGRGAFLDLFGDITALRSLARLKLLQEPLCGITNAFRIRSLILAGLKRARHVKSFPPA